MIGDVITDPLERYRYHEGKFTIQMDEPDLMFIVQADREVVIGAELMDKIRYDQSPLFRVQDMHSGPDRVYLVGYNETVLYEVVLHLPSRRNQQYLFGIDEGYVLRRPMLGPRRPPMLGPPRPPYQYTPIRPIRASQDLFVAHRPPPKRDLWVSVLLGCVWALIIVAAALIIISVVRGNW